MLTFDESGTFVQSMVADSEVVMPPACAPLPKKGAGAVLCSPAFRELAHERGSATARLVDEHSDDAGSTYVFAAVITGSGECGAYGFWAIRVDTKVHVTPPVAGCFMLQEEAGAEKSPRIQWGPPLVFSTQAYGGARDTFVLDDGTFQFQRKR